MATSTRHCFNGKIIQNGLSRFILGELLDAVSRAHTQLKQAGLAEPAMEGRKHFDPFQEGSVKGHCENTTRHVVVCTSPAMVRVTSPAMVRVLSS